MKVLGVCGGNGVVLFPFKKYLMGNIEPRTAFKTPNDIQWELNFPGIPLVKELDSVEFNGLQPDIIIGAPDCGHSSVLSYSRAKKLSDPNDNESLSLYWASIRLYKPKAFLMENLPKMLESLSPDLIEEIEKDYELTIFKDSVSKFGNSQITRVRLVIIGVNRQLLVDSRKVISTLNKIYPVKELKNTRDLLNDLPTLHPEFGQVREPDDTVVCMSYKGRKLNLGQVRDIWNNQYRDQKQWSMPGTKMKNLPGVYKNFAGDPPKTVRKQNRQFTPDGYQMSPREMARIQGVPDRFKIWIDEERLGYSINKGRVTVTKCPPYEIGRWFYKQIKKTELWQKESQKKM